MFKVDLDNIHNLLESIDEIEDDELLEEEEIEEDPENDELIVEQILRDCMSDEELNECLQDPAERRLLVESGILSEKTIVRFDKQAKLSRAESQAILGIAKEKNDKDFKKLLTIWKMRKFLLKKLERKYGNQAKVRAKKNMRKVTNTPGKIAKKVASAFKKKK